jgi:anaerobic carbon-monoxide dehydrogenase iron sulfur subunit
MPDTAASEEECPVSKMLAIDIAKCTGCHVCELMCSFQHHEEFNPRKARIHTTVFLHDELAVPVVCSQCEDAWCERICPTGAISTATLSESGARLVQVDEKKCVGCRMCALACPFGAIEIGSAGRAEKCDLCEGDPLCVQFCPRGALRFVEAEDRETEKRQKLAEALAESYRESE